MFPNISRINNNQRMKSFSFLVLFLSALISEGFCPNLSLSGKSKLVLNERKQEQLEDISERRQFISSATTSAIFGAASLIGVTTKPANAVQQSSESNDFLQQYEDFTMDPKGWSYKDAKVGTGSVNIQTGDRVVYDWSGYTIGYFGRPFEAKGGPQGGAFDKEIDYFRTVIGSKTIVPALEEALMSMKPGGIRQVVVPYGELSYPANDVEHTRVGPKPATFSGQRALNFVLENQRVDRTLLFNVKVIRVDKADGKGGFIRG